MNEQDGRAIAEHALDVVAVAEERHPGARLLAFQTTLVLKTRDGSVRMLNVAKGRQ